MSNDDNDYLAMSSDGKLEEVGKGNKNSWISILTRLVLLINLQ